ncbi:MAG: CoA ester lyase [Nitriliruptorales bacterium]|nr:CoA ester lyase [Nitriliruptorales bacterium]
MAEHGSRRGLVTAAGWSLRSLLFVPADRPERIPKAVAAGPDAVIVDLEDATSPDNLERARTNVVGALQDVTGVRRVVRVHNASDPAMRADLEAVVGPAVDGIMLAKVDGPQDVAAAAAVMDELEAAAGIAAGATALLPLVESCQGLRLTYEITRASSRVNAMVFSSGEEGDFMADLGGRWTPDGVALHYPRSRFLCDVRAAADVLVIDGVSMFLDDPGIWASESRIARVMGYDGKLAIHPKQIPTIHDAFTPSEREISDAAAMLAAFDAAQGRGAIRHEGRMVDPANARIARRILARAGVNTPERHR